MLIRNTQEFTNKRRWNHYSSKIKLSIRLKIILNFAETLQMKPARIIYILFASLLLIINLSCKKNKGCTDKDATNFNSEVTEDDGSCNYVSYIVFWYNQTTANDLVAAGYSTLKCVVDGAGSTSSASSVHFNAAPSCGQTGSMTMTEQMGNIKSKSVSYSITDGSSGTVIWSGTISINANDCVKKYLQY